MEGRLLGSGAMKYGTWSKRVEQNIKEKTGGEFNGFNIIETCVNHRLQDQTSGFHSKMKECCEMQTIV